MSETPITLEDETVAFIPERLNRDPIVLRGLTSNEMFLATVLGCVAGLLLGILVWLVIGEIAMIPTCLFAGGAAALFFGGALLRRAKRGKPETWLYRHLQWKIRYRLGFTVGASVISRSGFWAVRRERRQPSGKTKKAHP